MKCMCMWVIVERNFAIQTHKSVVSVFSSVRAIKVLWNICVCECVSVFSFLKSIPWKRNGSKYTIYTSLLLLPLLLLLVETFRNRWLSAPSDLVSNSFAYTLLIFSSVSCRRKVTGCFCCAVRNYLFSLQNTAIEKIGFLLFIISSGCSRIVYGMKICFALSV